MDLAQVPAPATMADAVNGTENNVNEDIRRIDMQDYDSASSLVTWCQGEALGEGFEPYVILVPGSVGPQYAKDGDFIGLASDGSFRVIPGVAPDACPACEGSGADPEDPGEWVSEAGAYLPTSPCPDCNGSGRTSQQGVGQ